MSKIASFILGVLTSTAVIAADDLSNDPEVQKTLKAMHNASTWFHPDLYGLTQVMQEYARRQYAAALKHFEFGHSTRTSCRSYALGSCT